MITELTVTPHYFHSHDMHVNGHSRFYILVKGDKFETNYGQLKSSGHSQASSNAKIY